MITFIQRLAEYLWNNYEDFCRLIVVFPNKRPAVFLHRALGQLTEKPVFAPNTYSIRDFVYSKTEYAQTDNITLLLRLYHAYRKIGNIKSEYGFEHFIGSGEILLSDFNDIDNWMIDSRQLFSNLEKAKAIELWNPGKPELTDMQKQYLDFFQNMNLYYEAYREDLKSLGIAYEGMAFRTLAEKIMKGDDYTEPGHNYIFAGFNALNKAEEVIISHFVDHSNAKLIWDADEAYVYDNNQEAGRFIRENIKKFSDNEPKWIDSVLLNTEKNITVTGAPLSVSQAKYAGQLIDEIYQTTKDEINNTVIVPADESTLPMLLESIPPHIENINITMGQSLKQSLIFQLINSYVKIYVDSYKNIQKSKHPKFYYLDLVNFFKQRLFKYLYLSENENSGQQIADIILNRNNLFYTFDDITRIVSENPELLKMQFPEKLYELFSDITTPKKLAQNCIKICNAVEKSISDKEILTLSMVVVMADVLEILSDYFSKAEVEISFSGFDILFQRLVATMQIPFEGEPLGGLQIMGFLETRCIDFKNVILTNINEGFLPAGSRKMQTFIPFDLRAEFKMTMPGHKDAMYAYCFWRLLQRAENVWILYNTEPDAFSGKEMSRFIRQLFYEFKLKTENRWNVKHQILQVNIKFPSSFEQHEGNCKSANVIKTLVQRFEKGYTATALFDYLKCPFMFYLKYILKTEETKTQVSGIAEMNVLGTVIHDTLAELYLMKVNTFLDEKFFIDSEKLYPSIISKYFTKHYPEGEIERGKNLIMYKVALKMTENVLRTDKKHSVENRIKPLLIEKDIQAEIDYQNKYCTIRGKIDRVDKFGETIRIADYKTGKPTSNIKIITKKHPDPDVSSLNEKQFQLLFYLLLFSENEELLKLTENVTPTPGIIFLRRNFTEFAALEYSEQEKNIPLSFLSDFKKFIIDMVAELNNPDIPFRRTNNSDNCVFCAFASVCNYFSAVIKTDENYE